MPPTTVNTMPRSSQIHTSVLNTPSNPATDNISLREFVVDEDAENFNAALWRTIDQNAFILAQRDALEAFNVAKALRLSKETAAAELERRQAVNVTVAAAESQSPPSSRHQRHGSQPIAINKGGNTIPHSQHAPLSDEAIARSLARSWQVDAFQPAGLENRSSPSSSSPVKPIKFSPPSSSHHHQQQQDRKAPASSIAKQNSRTQLSLSTSSFPGSSSHSHSHSHSAAVESRHSRSTSQSNTFTKVPSLALPSIPPVREPVATDDPTGSTPPFSQFQTSDITHAKRRRTERKPSLDVVVVAPPISEPQKSSTFLRNLRPGTIIPTAKDNSASSMSTSEGSKSLLPPPPPPPSKPIKVPKQKAYRHDPFNDVHKCPQCGNRLTTPRIQLSTTLNSRSLCDALHYTCSSCMTRHCRGCTSISPCTRPCAPGQNPTSCAVRNCCYNVRAVVIFEALNIFDHVFATEAGFTPTTTSADGVDPDDPHGSFHSGRQQREAYIKILISKADKSMRKFEDAFVRTLRVICSWLQFSPEVDFDADDKTSPAFGNPSYLNDSIPRLLLASYLPEVIHTFLSNNNVRDWIAHSETYTMILETLRWISNFPTLSKVLNLPLPHVQRNCTLRQWNFPFSSLSILMITP
ncbi:hypothetical protein BYT27DRAFT_6849641 [Phlegmacium glaucopus]|nr:hypothetical protein BYT27DRAFT_6849641 [Phlegmacium glaucopus]